MVKDVANHWYKQCKVIEWSILFFFKSALPTANNVEKSLADEWKPIGQTEKKNENENKLK